MNKRVVLFFLIVSLFVINKCLPVKANTYKDEVTIHFKNETYNSTDQKDFNANKELFIGKKNDKNNSILPKTGEMITSVIVLLGGIIIILLLILVCLIRDINKLKRIEGN